MEKVVFSSLFIFYFSPFSCIWYFSCWNELFFKKNLIPYWFPYIFPIMMSSGKGADVSKILDQNPPSLITLIKTQPKYGWRMNIYKVTSNPKIAGYYFVIDYNLFSFKCHHLMFCYNLKWFLKIFLYVALYELIRILIIFNQTTGWISQNLERILSWLKKLFRMN